MLVKLRIENDLPAIRKLIDTVFNQLLKLEQYDDVEIDILMKQIKTTNQLRSVLTSEYNLFCNDNSNPTFRYKAKEGVFGYWKLMIVPTTEGYKITSKFFSDALYAAGFL